jgi:hypothetical protein
VEGVCVAARSLGNNEVMKARKSQDSKFSRWKRQSRNAADTSGEGAVEEHRRFEESLTASGDMDEFGAVRVPDEKILHDTPSDAEQTAG